MSCFLDVGKINQVSVCVLKPLQCSLALIIFYPDLSYGLIVSNLVWKQRLFRVFQGDYWGKDSEKV